MRKKAPPPAPHPADRIDTVPRNGFGAGSALQAMLKKRQMRASAEPQPPELPTGKSGGE